MRPFSSGIEFLHPTGVHRLRRKLLARLVEIAPAVAFDQFWKPVAEEQLRRREQDSRPTHHLVQLPHVSRRSAGLLGPLSGLLVDG